MVGAVHFKIITPNVAEELKGSNFACYLYHRRRMLCTNTQLITCFEVRLIRLV